MEEAVDGLYVLRLQMGQNLTCPISVMNKRYTDGTDTWPNCAVM